MNIKIIDNFLNDEDFNELCLLKLKQVKENEIIVYHNQIYKNQEVKCDCIAEKTVRRLFKNYHEKAMNLLKELSPKKINLYEYSTFHIIETGANYKFPIHDDTPNKLLSGVVYLRPEKNSGTMFYKNKKGHEKQIIDWKQNRAVFFSRSERQTWHSYQGDGKSNRICLVYNLMTNNLREVCKIENKSYLITRARYLINPYLFRYFKIIV